MIPTDFRNATFDGLRASLEGLRKQAYYGWLLHGPGTTREVAARCNMDLLTFRPRTTELVELGLVVLADGQHSKREGVYRVASKERWEAVHQDQAKGQMTLL